MSMSMSEEGGRACEGRQSGRPVVVGRCYQSGPEGGVQRGRKGRERVPRKRVPTRDMVLTWPR